MFIIPVSYHTHAYTPKTDCCCVCVCMYLRMCGEGNSTPLQYSCLENLMDGGPGRLQSMGSLRVGHD